MSLKSFDKFCESLITGEPSSQKAIFDERQNQLRQKYTIEALVIFGAAAILNTIIMECGAMWCESYAMPMVFFCVVSYMYWIIRNCANGTLFGVSGTSAVTTSAGCAVGMGIVYTLINLPDGDEGWSNFFLHNGMVGESVVLCVSFLLYAVCGVIILVKSRGVKKQSEQNSEK